MYKIFLIVAIVLIYHEASSQTVNQRLISSAQKTVAADEFSYSWSIGETIINSNDLNLSAGYHSEAKIMIGPITSNNDENSSFPITFFPNPTSRYLNIDLSQLPRNPYLINLYDPKGVKITPTIKGSDNIKTIDINELKTGLYQLYIIDKNTNKTIKQFKVIKK